MFTELWDLLKQIAVDLTPLAKIDAWERGVILRFGRFSRERGPGWWFKIPAFERCVTTPVVTTTATLSPQSLTTSDDKLVVVEAIVRYSVADVRKFLLEVYDRTDAINDTTMGIIAKSISAKSWDDCIGGGAEQEITKRTKVALRRWGIQVDEVTLTTLTKMPSIRIVGSLPTPNLSLDHG